MTEATTPKTRQVNKTLAKADVETPGLSEINKEGLNEEGKYVGVTKTEKTLQKAAEERARGTKLGKNLTVRTKSGGHMYYFDAQRWITGNPTVVPDSSWLQLQLAQHKVELVD